MVLVAKLTEDTEHHVSIRSDTSIMKELGPCEGQGVIPATHGCGYQNVTQIWDQMDGTTAAQLGGLVSWLGCGCESWRVGFPTRLGW